MPRYQFTCEGCGQLEEVDRSFEECYRPPDKECPKCGEEKWRKLLNAGIVRWRYCD